MAICSIDFLLLIILKKKLITKYTPGKDCAHPLEHLNIINKKSFLKM